MNKRKIVVCAALALASIGVTSGVEAHSRRHRGTAGGATTAGSA